MLLSADTSVFLIFRMVTINASQGPNTALSLLPLPQANLRLPALGDARSSDKMRSGGLRLSHRPHLIYGLEILAPAIPPSRIMKAAAARLPMPPPTT
jgi:hypothetical protein